MIERKGTVGDWNALRRVLDYADMALHAHAQGWEAPEMPSREQAKAWLDDSFVLRRSLQLRAADKAGETPR